MTGYILTVLLFVWAPTLAGGHCEGTTLVDTYGYVLLEESRVLPDVTLRAISIKFCLMRDLDIQIWRRSGGNLFTLEWSVRITPQSLEQDIVHDIPAVDVIRLRPSEHRLGLYVPDHQDLPIFAKWGPGEHQTFYSDLDGPFLLNKSYAFMTDLVNPIGFNITLCGNRGCNSDVPRPTQPASTTTATTTTEATTVPPLFCNLVNYRTAGRALVESERRLPGGILRGVRVRSCLLQPYLLQIWEWAGTAGYTLVWQRWIVPITDDGSLQVVLFGAEEYVVSSATYRAGVQLDPYVTLSIPDTRRGPDLMLLQSRDARDFSPCRSAHFQPADFIWDLALDFCTTRDCSPSNDIEDYLPYTSPCPTEPPFMVTSPTTTMTSSKPTLVTSPTTMMTSPTTMMTSPTKLMTSPATMIPTMIVTDRATTQSSLKTTSTMQTTSGVVSGRTPGMPMRTTDATTMSRPVRTTDVTTMSRPVRTTDATTMSRPVRTTDATTMSRPVRTTDATTMSRPVRTTQMPNVITTQSSVKPTLIGRTTSTVTTSRANIPTTASTSTLTRTDTTPMSSSTPREVNVMTTPIKATTVTETTSMLPTTKRPQPTTRRTTTTTAATIKPTTTTTMRPTTIKTTTTKAATKKPTTPRPKTTTKKVVKPTQSQNNIVKTNAKAAAASGSNNGRGIHPKLAVGSFIIIGTLNCLLMLPFL